MFLYLCDTFYYIIIIFYILWIILVYYCCVTLFIIYLLYFMGNSSELLFFIFLFVWHFLLYNYYILCFMDNSSVLLLFFFICGYVLNGFSVIKQIFLAALEKYEGRKEMFYLTMYSTHFYLRLYGVGHMVTDQSDSWQGCHMGYSFWLTDRISHTTVFVTPVVEH